MHRGQGPTRSVFVEFWDIGGRATYERSRSVFYGAYNGLVLVHDLTNRKSYANLRRWIAEVTLPSVGNETGAVAGSVLSNAVTGSAASPYAPVSGQTPDRRGLKERHAYRAATTEPDAARASDVLPVLIVGTHLDQAGTAARDASVSEETLGESIEVVRRRRIGPAPHARRPTRCPPQNCLSCDWLTPGCSVMRTVTAFLDRVVAAPLYVTPRSGSPGGYIGTVGVGIGPRPDDAIAVHIAGASPTLWRRSAPPT